MQRSVPFFLPSFGSDQSRGKAQLVSVDLPRRDRKPVIDQRPPNWPLCEENHFVSDDTFPYLLKTLAIKSHSKKKFLAIKPGRILHSIGGQMFILCEYGLS